MRSVSLVFSRNLSLIGDNAGSFPSAFALNGSARARINMLGEYDLSDERLRESR